MSETIEVTPVDELPEDEREELESEVDRQLGIGDGTEGPWMIQCVIDGTNAGYFTSSPILRKEKMRQVKGDLEQNPAVSDVGVMEGYR